MNNRGFKVLLAIVFALIALVTCLLVLVALLMMWRGGPSLAWPSRSTPVIVVAPTPQPTINLQPTIIIMPVPSMSLPTKDASSLSLATQIIVVITPAGAQVPTATPIVMPRATRAAPSPTSGPSPTPTYPNNIKYVQDGPVQPDTKRACMGGSVFGTIRDVEGNPVGGVRVKVYNEYITDFSAPSKPVGATDAGFYDFVVNPKPSNWKVVVVDGGNNPISPEANVVRPPGVEVCFFRVDWKATR